MSASATKDSKLQTTVTLQQQVRVQLLQSLIGIQQQYSCIPRSEIEKLQQQSALTRTQIESVISFYSFLSIEHQGKYRVLFSDNITDRMAGNQQLYQRLSAAVADCDAVTIGFTSCTGLSDQGPGLLVNGIAINRLDGARIDQIAQLICSQQPLSAWPAALFQIDDNIQRRDQQLSTPIETGASIRSALKLGPQRIMQLLTESGLRGRGGAGFKTATKWNCCIHSASTERYVVCNADEGEPGTFKDRVLLNSYAHGVIEGMSCCALVIGARQGFIYLRAEYYYLLDHLNQLLQHQRDQNLLGNNILGVKGFDFDIQIHLGAGAYICGEESSLIESLEGKRGIPRIRPPFPVIRGYQNQPTVVNNVETFWSVSHIIMQGSEWFTTQGTQKSKGTRLLSISGDCSRPGIYEYPCGVSLHDILQDCGGQDAQAVQIAGAAGNLVLAKDFQRCMSFEDLPTGGSFMVIGAQRSLIDLLQNFAQFFKHESCGFCTPCRVGTTVIDQLIGRFKRGQGCRGDLQQLKQTAQLMKQTSFCGLGTSAPTAFLDAIKHCPELFENLMTADSDNPAFDLEQATSEFQQLTCKTGKETRHA